jgi:hypothetical protein
MEVPAVLLRQRQGRMSILRLEHLITSFTQRTHGQPPDNRLVLDDQDSFVAL